jgi:hypothetical protein
MTINIREIISRSDQGITRPFLCRADDGHLYYVKGACAGRKALVSEWLAGHIGKTLGLPIPAFDLAMIPEDLTQGSARDDIADLGAGMGFASRAVENADELSYLFIGQIEPNIRAKILLFDWWTANGDRTLSEHGGNPNLLWFHRDHKLHVIDHNLAFDEKALPEFWSQHIFAAERGLWTKHFRDAVTPAMQAALEGLEEWWHAMPGDWTEIESGITLKLVKKLLWRFQTQPAIFWGVQ